MKSDLPKVLAPLKNKPLIYYVLNSISVNQFNFNKVVLVVGYKSADVKNYVSELNRGLNVEFALQNEQLGTGHAVMQAENLFVKDDLTEDILILYGDVPLLSNNTIKCLLEKHKSNNATLTILTAIFDNPFNYGRIIRSDAENMHGQIMSIVEERDANEYQKLITEINSGIYVVKKDFLFNALKQIKPANDQNELYLTDIVNIASNQNHKIASFVLNNDIEVQGVNTVEQLKELEQYVDS
ncbi:NTP transferase domain-containing protein [Candidatus Woesearchaeota archaeon]|nr:NTP transferase domain-containing protein [Candidatus Woesearchaeota archaeon]MBT6519626.1 NTP transferase domain-containing protein [Candidatus Woesearchaeota archaeon]MBT7367541.1 NTP transferase domain-containing protein [Candidatus Woesearchaeota archaeon]